MRQEEQDRIKNYYDRTGEWNINERYSEKGVTVYTKNDDKYHWLVIEENKQGIEVQQTDEQGTIIARDYYRYVANKINCIGMERLCENGFGMALFMEKELQLLYLLKGTEKERIQNDLRMLALKDNNDRTRNSIMTLTVKLEALSKESFSEFITTIRNYQFLEKRKVIKESVYAYIIMIMEYVTFAREK